MAKKKQKPRKAAEFQRPNFEIGMQDVENPEFSRDHAEGKLGNLRMVKATVNVRESAISLLAARGLIEPNQAAAAVKFRQLWEAMGGAGASAMDYTREPVDGGGMVDPIKPRQIEAGKELKLCRELLGAYGYKLVGYICGEGHSVHDLTETRRQRDTMTDNLKMYLDQLAKMWGYGQSKLLRHRNEASAA